MRILFLDIDGVLNSWQSIYWEIRQDVRKKQESLCPIAMSNLDELLKKVPDLKIVISSTWRRHFTIAELQVIMTEQGFKSADRIIGATPTDVPKKFSELMPRLREIRVWLAEHPEVTQWCAVDDHDLGDDGEELAEGQVVYTDQHVGLDWYKIEELRKIFKAEKEFGVCLM